MRHASNAHSCNEVKAPCKLEINDEDIYNRKSAGILQYARVITFRLIRAVTFSCLGASVDPSPAVHENGVECRALRSSQTITLVDALI